MRSRTRPPSCRPSSTMTEAVAVEFADPGGDPLRVEWRVDALAALDPVRAPEAPIWRLGGELDWDQVEALRVLSGRLADGRLIALAALRPAGAAGHGDELLSGMIGPPGELEQLAEPLVSTEYGGDQVPRRIGLELYRDPDGLPLRITAEATASTTSKDAGVRRVSTLLALRASGETGTAVLDLLDRAS
jgi:hypothetical protein